jgi:hypothetical protein
MVDGVSVSLVHTVQIRVYFAISQPCSTPIVAIHELAVSLMVALYSPVGTKYGRWGEHPTCTDCANTYAFRNIVAMQHPIVAIHESSTSSLVALYSLAATTQSGLSVPLCPVSANNAMFGNIVAMQYPHRRHTLALYQLSGRSIIASSHQAEWVERPPIVPAPQIMPYSAT